MKYNTIMLFLKNISVLSIMRRTHILLTCFLISTVLVYGKNIKTKKPKEYFGHDHWRPTKLNSKGARK